MFDFVDPGDDPRGGSGPCGRGPLIAGRAGNRARAGRAAPPGRRPMACALVVLAAIFGMPAAVVTAAETEEAVPIERAFELWREGYVLHLIGEYDRAIGLFRESIEVRPTAEAQTYLGWSLSHLGRLEEAIGACMKAIALDPDYGNPYNDIGVYLIDMGRADEAIPWLKKAMRTKRYCCYQFPHFNLGRILLGQGSMAEAKLSFQRALSYDPQYQPARKALDFLREQGLDESEI